MLEKKNINQSNLKRKQTLRKMAANNVETAFHLLSDLNEHFIKNSFWQYQQ